MDEIYKSYDDNLPVVNGMDITLDDFVHMHRKLNILDSDIE
jgi:hypothetical protein